MSYKWGAEEGSEYKFDDESQHSVRSDSKVSEGKDILTHRAAGESSEMDLLKEVQQFFFSNNDLASSFESFINERSDVVDLSTDEYKLEYTTIFREYSALFERKMEDFIVNTLHSDVYEFYRLLKVKVEEGEDSMDAFFAQVLIAVTDFDLFMTMMREAKLKRSEDSICHNSSHK